MIISFQDLDLKSDLFLFVSNKFLKQIFSNDNDSRQSVQSNHTQSQGSSVRARVTL